MSDIQDEAYSEAMAEIDRLRTIVGPLQAANTAYSREGTLSEREIERLKDLLTIAANELSPSPLHADWCRCRVCNLIGKLREAAK